MSAPPLVPVGVPPLPLGWTQHIGPAGQVYYYNSQTQESTYVRPLPSFVAQGPQGIQQTKKKEKAQLKTAILGTDWLRVTTTEGNTFYSNKVTKQSSWTIPPEIIDSVHAHDAQEAERRAKASSSNAEVAPTIPKAEKETTKDAAKRKREDPLPLDEIVISKKAKVDEGEGDGDSDISQDSGEEEEEEEEEWQREAAEQLAKEAEEERQRQEEEDKSRREEEEKAEKELRQAQLNMPAKVDLSIDEAKALFKTLLREKDINPLHPWDSCLPKFISDPRYVLLPSVTARREAFDEYCRERARELRESTVRKETQEANPQEEFSRLLKEEVRSTRTSWIDFRRAWKKDRRFFGWGRDEREREKAFREYLRELGEKKRAAAQRAEGEFFALLGEHREIKEGALWKDVKKSLYSDSRYDAVGSSSLREELFNTYLKGIVADTGKERRPPSGDTPASQNQERVSQESREARKERALKEREQKVKAQQGLVSMGIEKSRMGMNQEEGERVFKTMLVDAIRDPQITWDAALLELKGDPRFTNSPLPHHQQVKLFHAHTNHLRSKHLSALHASFEENAPSLDSRFSELPLEKFSSSFHSEKLGYDINQLEDEFDRWQRQRYTDARHAFDEMLSENSFVEFWGRLGKLGDVPLDQGLQITSEDIGEVDEEGSNKVDMKALAKTVDIGEMVKVLKRDKRFSMFDHVPEQREGWLRDYLSNLSAPKLSVHVPS